MNDLEGRYPRTLPADPASGAGDEVTIDRMTPADEAAVLAFARTLPEHDLLFLRRDITQPRVMSAWASRVADGSIVSLLARRGGEIVGCSAIVSDPLSWSAHVGELRVLLSPDDRSRGLGRVLIQESFLLALDAGLEKLIAHMTPDQRAAIAVFEDLGFRGEALLRDHVADGEGRRHDLVILAHDVERFSARLDAFGVTEALA